MDYAKLQPFLEDERMIGQARQARCPLCRAHMWIQRDPMGENEVMLECINRTQKCSRQALYRYYEGLFSREDQWQEEENPEPPSSPSTRRLRSQPEPHPGRFNFPLIGFEELCRLEPPVWQIENLFLEESLMQVFGQSGHTKSLFVFDLALSICCEAETWFGRRILKYGPVIWVNADGGRGLTLRANAWMEAHKMALKHPFLTLMGSVHLHQNDQMAAFRGQLEAMSPKPVLVVFDTLSRCIPGVDENSQAEMTKVTENCHRLKLGTGATICLIHHTDKTGQWERGSSIVRAETDTQIRVTKDDATGLSTVSSRKCREGEPFRDFHFRLQPVGESVIVVATEGPSGESPQERRFSNVEDALDAIRARPGVTREELAQWLNTSSATISRYVVELVERREITMMELPREPGRTGPSTKGLFPVWADDERNPRLIE